MKRLVVILCLLPALAHAACPEIPAAERVRIVECRSGYAVQELREVYDPTGFCVGRLPNDCRPNADKWVTRIGCGAELRYAQRHKADIIEELEIADLGNCAPPNLPLEPVRVVK
jgi:hypothetical protein